MLTSSMLVRALPLVSRIAPPVAGHVAFDLFCEAPARSPLRPGEAKVMAGAERGELVRHGVPVQVYRWATSSTSTSTSVLVVHGFGGRAANFVALVPVLLAAGVSVVAFDAPGHGESGGRGATVVDNRDIMLALGASHGPFEAVIGHSFGGLSAIHAVRAGLPVRALVTIASMCEFACLPAAFARLLGAPRLEAQLRARTERLFPEHGPLVWERFSASYQPERVDADVWVVHDDDDVEVAPAQADLLVSAFGPRARSVRTTGLGHRRILRDRRVLTTVRDIVTGDVDVQG